MPLTNEQKEFINSAIVHLIDLPYEEKTLREEVNHLKQALDEKSLEVTHPYHLLQKCYCNPTAYFHRLENLNPDITVGEVQVHICDFVTHQVQKAAEQAQMNLTDLQWDHQRLALLLYQSTEFKAPFQSEHLTFDTGEHDQNIPIHPGKIYRAEFIQQWEFHVIQVKITIDLPGWEPFDGETFDYPEDIDSDEAENEFMRSLQTTASEHAEATVIESILHYLHLLKVLTTQQKEHASRGAKKLLMYRFYLHALLTNQIDFEEINQLGESQAERIADPAIIGLISAGKCDIQTAKNFTPEEHTVLINPFYSSEMINDQIKLDEIKGLSKHQSRNLILPPVIYLLRNKKISLIDAKSITPGAKAAIKSEHCIYLIMNNKLSFDEAKKLRPDEAKVLAEPYYCSEIYNNRLQLSEIKKHSSNQNRNLLIPSIMQLLKKNTIQMKDAISLAYDARPVFEHEFYSHLLLGNQLNFAEIKDLSRYEADLLLTPKIIQLIEARILTVKEALQLTGREKEIFLKEHIHKLLMTKKILPSEAKKLSFDLIHLIEKNICLFGLLFQGIFQLQECLSVIDPNEVFSDPLTLWGLTFGGRLIGVYKNNPYRERGQLDNFHLIKYDIEQVAEQRSQFPQHLIVNQAIIVFVRYLQTEIANEIKNTHHDDFNYIKFLSELHAAGDNQNGIHSLNRMLEIAKHKLQTFPRHTEERALKRTKISSSLFVPVLHNEDIERIALFCHKINQLVTLVDSENNALRRDVTSMAVL